MNAFKKCGDWHHAGLICSLAVVLSMLAHTATAKCKGPGNWPLADHDAKPEAELQTPGFADVGAGLFNISGSSTANNDATGFMVTIKAYPMRRHYAQLLPVSNLASLTNALAASTDSGAKSTNPGNASPAPAASSGPTYTLGQIADATSLSSQIKADDNFYSICTNNVWQYFGSRFFYYYGRSVGSPGDSNISGGVNAVGLGYDIDPYFSVIGGYAFYDTSINSVRDSRNAVLFGVQFNLTAYKFFQGIWSATSSASLGAGN